MQITRIKLKKWLNLRKADVDLAESTYVIGPNAAGKSIKNLYALARVGIKAACLFL